MGRSKPTLGELKSLKPRKFKEPKRLPHNESHKRCRRLVIKLTPAEEDSLEQQVKDQGLKNKSELVRKLLGF